MHLVKSGLDSENVAVQFGIARHCLPVDIVAQRLGNGDASGGQFLHIVGEAEKGPR